MTKQDPYPVTSNDSVKELEEKFEQEFQHWNENHNLPLKKKKGFDMPKPNLSHIACITRTQNLLETGVNVSDNPRLKKSIEDDILKLAQVRQILYEIIENPSLPFAGPENDEVKNAVDTPRIPQEPVLDPIGDAPDAAF